MENPRKRGLEIYVYEDLLKYINTDYHKSLDQYYIELTYPEFMYIILIKNVPIYKESVSLFTGGLEATPIQDKYIPDILDWKCYLRN